MRLINTNILKGFLKRDGHLIFWSSIITKITNFTLSILIVRFISKEEFGLLTYAMTIITFFTPFMGLGLNHSLLRFGSIEKKNYNKKKLYHYSLKYGLYGSLIFVILVIALSKFIVINKPGALNYLIFLSVVIITRYPYLILLSKTRIFEKNKDFSKIQVGYAVLSLIIIGFLTYLYTTYGYILGTVIVPALIYIFFSNEKFQVLYKELRNIKFDFTKYIEYYKYAIFVGLGSIASQFAILSDNLIIGNLISNPEELATYKVGSLIPMNLVFIPSIFLVSDFVHIAKNHLDTTFLKKYYINYLKFFIPITLFLVTLILILSKYFIPLFFGKGYAYSITIINVLSIGLIAVFLLRIPLGNILGAVGKANWNTYNAVFLVFINIVLTITFVKKHGIVGAAYATSIVFWISGIISLFLYMYYIKNTNTIKK